MIFAIDFDGTCVTHEFPRVGRDIGAAQVLRRIVKSGHKIILYTMRSDVEKPISDNLEIISLGGDYLSQAIDWFNKNHIPLFGINENPEQKSWTHSPKPYANVYIDDAALGCPLISDGKNRPFVDWVTIERILEHQGYLT
jgi:hypothetical protein